MEKLTWFYKGWMLIMMILIMGLAGCSQDNNHLTAPESSIISDGITLLVTDAVAAYDAVMASNFNTSDDVPKVDEDEGWYRPDQPMYIVGFWGRIPGRDVFGGWVSVTQAGDYLMTYETWYGLFHILFRALAPGSVGFYLQYNDSIFNWYIQKGVIMPEPPVTFKEGEDIIVFGDIPYQGEAPPEFVGHTMTYLRRPEAVFSDPEPVDDPWDEYLEHGINPEVGLCHDIAGSDCRAPFN